MKFCPNCGIELDNNNFKFCPECGYKFGSEIPQYEPKEFIGSVLKNIRDETDKYVDKLRDIESLDGMMENAKTILKGSEKEDVDDEKIEIKIDDEDINHEANSTKEDTSNKEEDEFVQDETSTENMETFKTVEETTSEPHVKQETEEIDYSNLFLSDLEETLIKTLPIINNPYEYEENIIKKYSEYNSEERKELLKDCWTVTKLAEKHNITRHEVEKAILTDEFLYKNLIGVFKVNPNNIRSLKILYRKPLNQKQQRQEISDETKEELVNESKINENIKVEEVKVEEKESKESSDEMIEEIVEEKFTENKKTQQQEMDKTFYNKKDPNAKVLKKEFNSQLKFYIGSFGNSEDFKKRLIRHNKMKGDTNFSSIKSVLKKEFENGNLALEDIEKRIDELLALDVLALNTKVAQKKQDTSFIKTQEDLNKYLGPEYISKFKKKVDRKSKGQEIFKKYNVDIKNAYCFECKYEQQKEYATSYEFKNITWGNGYVALFDDRIIIADESFLLKVNLSIEKIFFDNIDFISFEKGNEESPSTLYIGLRTKGQIILGYILPKDAEKVIETYEKYMGKSSSSKNINKADELLKYAELYEKGLLTKEEFETKKKELL